MIQQVALDLWVGDEAGFKMLHDNPDFRKQWSFVGAAKNPFHKQHARHDGVEEEGYVEKALPSNSKEYLYAEREHALYLNLIDVDDPKYINVVLVATATHFIHEEMSKGRKVLICCNKGESRAPSVAFMAMIEDGHFDGMTFEQAVSRFKAIYPYYRPKKGISHWVETVWRCHNEREAKNL